MIYLSYSLLDSFLTKQWCPLRSCSSDGGYPTSLFLGSRQRQERWSAHVDWHAPPCEKVSLFIFGRISLPILNCSPYFIWRGSSCFFLFTVGTSPRFHLCTSSKHVQTSSERWFYLRPKWLWCNEGQQPL